jgi:hypothetical protein
MGHWVHSTASLCWSYKRAGIDLFVLPDELIDTLPPKMVKSLLAINGLPPLPPDAWSR